MFADFFCSTFEIHIHSKKYMCAKKRFPKQKRISISIRAELMELFISHIHNSIYVMKLRTERGEVKRKYECFMKLVDSGSSLLVHIKIQFEYKICSSVNLFVNPTV